MTIAMRVKLIFLILALLGFKFLSKETGEFPWYEVFSAAVFVLLILYYDTVNGIVDGTVGNFIRKYLPDRYK